MNRDDVILSFAFPAIFLYPVFVPRVYDVRVTDTNSRDEKSEIRKSLTPVHIVVALAGLALSVYSDSTMPLWVAFFIIGAMSWLYENALRVEGVSNGDNG